LLADAEVREYDARRHAEDLCGLLGRVLDEVEDLHPELREAIRTGAALMPSGGCASRGGGGLSIAVTAIVLLDRNALDWHQLERAVIADADWPPRLAP
jgi:hypothetical protein